MRKRIQDPEPEKDRRGSSPVVFETGRLLVRAAQRRDAPFYLRLWTDPRVMVNVGFPQGLAITSVEIETQIGRQVGGPLGRLLVVVLKSSGETIGECKMYPPDEQGISETDVKLLPEHWGHHYGVEIKRGLLAYLFSRTDCRAVQATPNVENTASIRMQEAVGGLRVGEGTYHFPESMQRFTRPVHHYVYRVYRQAWEEAQDEERPG